jgi:5-(carboxyamino)imidazole ribonucleotide mutase
MSQSASITNGLLLHRCHPYPFVSTPLDHNLQLHHFLISVLIAHATHDLISLSHMSNTAIVGIIMGSTSDWPTMEHAAKTLEDFGVAWEAQVVSAHRTPQKLYDFASSAKDRGLKVIIAGAGGAAHLPGMCAAMTPLPVLGVPVESKTLKGIDSLLSIVQMPAGIPTATFAIGKAGAINAALFAIAQLSTTDIVLAEKLNAFRSKQTQTVLDADLPPLA